MPADVNSTVVESSIPSYVVRDWCHTSYIAVVAQFSTSMTPELIQDEHQHGEPTFRATGGGCDSEVEERHR